MERPHQRTIVYVFTTGHLRIPAISPDGVQQATSAWLEAHKDLWAGDPGQARAVAGLVMEHFGAREFRDDSARKTYGPTGRPESELLYATTRELRDFFSRNGPEPIRPGLTSKRPDR